jgi:hypothetical protein
MATRMAVPMEVSVHTFSGRCHCGNIALTLETALAPKQLPLRECACSFCRKHGARTAADPAGRARIAVRDPALFSRYRFEHGTADFLICRACGIYVAAVVSDGGRAFATLNVRSFDDQVFFGREAIPVSYEGETADARRERRRERWTPVEIVEAVPPEPS